MADREEATPAGLIIAREPEEPAPKEKPKKERNLRWRGVHHHDVLDIDLRTEAKMETTHKLNPEQRKQRRMDNKAMAEIRKKTRGRKKHGRQ